MHLLSLLRESPLVASVQASEGSPVQDPPTLLRLARASAAEGVRLLRLEGSESIRTIREGTGLPAIGLIKRRYEGSEVYITATAREVAEALDAGAEIVALDGTARPRPHGETLADLITQIHRAGRLAMADCDTLASAHHARDCGADLVGTTLSGYTLDSPPHEGPDLDLVRAASSLGLPVLAEGRYSLPWQAQAALRAGALGVVVGGALNDPIKQTRAFARAIAPPRGPVGAVDIGGTWLRFGLFSESWELLHDERIPLLSTHRERMAWIRERLQASGATRLGISAGGTIHPATGEVIEAKPLIPDHLHRALRDPQIPTVALNDGLATAWGHACHPRFAGRRVSTLALGTGVGFGFVAEGRIWMGPAGQYPRLNDLPATAGSTYEDLLGGAALSSSPTEDAQARAREAARTALQTVQSLYFPDHVILAGGIGLSDWLDPATLHHLPARDDAFAYAWPQIERSPFGPRAGLYGAAALALFPPNLERTSG